MPWGARSCPQGYLVLVHNHPEHFGSSHTVQEEIRNMTAPISGWEPDTELNPGAGRKLMPALIFPSELLALRCGVPNQPSLPAHPHTLLCCWRFVCIKRVLRRSKQENTEHAGTRETQQVQNCPSLQAGWRGGISINTVLFHLWVDQHQAVHGLKRKNKSKRV